MTRAMTPAQQEPAIMNAIFYGAVPIIAALAIIGAGVPAAFWGIRWLVFDSVPQFLGFSCLWLDMVSGAALAMILVLYVEGALERRDGEFENDDEVCPLSFGEFVAKYRWFSLFGVFLAIDLVASIFFNFAIGLAAIVALAAMIGIGYGVRAAGEYALFLIFSWLGGFSDALEE